MSPASPDSWDIALKFLEILLVPFVAYVIRALSNINEELRTLRTVLIGADGKNGLRSRFRRMENKVDRLALAQAARHEEASLAAHHDTDEEEEE